MADEPPNLSVVAESEPWELEREQARRELAWDVREMAANLMRVMRGAGRPYELPQQIINLSEAILEVSKAARTWAVSSAIEETLQSAVPGSSLDDTDAEDRIGTIISGSLQTLASRLVHQRAQEAAGRREIADGIESRERYFERQREKFWAEQTAWRAQSIKPKRKAAKPRAKPKPKQQATASPPKSPEKQPEETAKPASTADYMKTRQRELRGEPHRDEID